MKNHWKKIATAAAIKDYQTSKMRLEEKIIEEILTSADFLIKRSISWVEFTDEVRTIIREDKHEK